MPVTYTIGEMAKKIGKSTKTLRNWDSKGILKAYRTPSNQRYYTHEQFLEINGKDKYKPDGSDMDAIKDKVLLITGGTGSLGHALVKRICGYAKKIIIYSRCELKQANMRQKFSDLTNLRYMIGDIRDKERLTMALCNVDVCIHAACMKRIETCTYNPFDAVKSNIIGTMNVIEACIKNKVSKSILVSTDKSCCPITLYGGTKFVSEQLFINSNNYSKNGIPIFTISRYGNVFSSNGSIRGIIEKQMKEGTVKVTHEDMTRFFMTLDEAVDLNLFALNNAIGGEIFIPKLKAASIMDFAQTFAPGYPIKIIGLRGPEKIHEELISETEMMNVVDLGKYYKVVPPMVSDPGIGWDLAYPIEPKIKPFRYVSNKVGRFTNEELKGLDGAKNEE